ncbi:hypothetical protein CPEL_0399 [Campylobacter peloridis LMG 23910]|nr:hypothetical protein CPEL_0399 [Campylobacter peloridis LMG 23910]
MFKILIIFIMIVIKAFSFDRYFFKENCSNQNLNLIQDPFFQKTINVKSDLSLQAIVANKAKINDKWYVLNDDIEGFKLVEIRNFEVILMDKERKVVLKLYEKNNNIVIY